jgi:hypothetical protein
MSGSFVIARNTAFTYKSKHVDVKQIGRELDVRYILEGSVQRGTNRLRVNVQLIDTETGIHLWAERFDKPVADFLDMQDEIVASLANQLGTVLIAAEARRAERAPNPVFDGRAEETERDVNEALRLSPRDKNAWAWMHFSGSAKLYLGANAEAVTRFHRAIELRRDFPLTHFWLGAASQSRQAGGGTGRNAGRIGP